MTFKRPAKDSITIQVEANLPPTYHQLVTNLSDQVKALIMCLKSAEMSIPEQKKIINLSPKSRRLFKEQYINQALNQGLLVMTHPESTGHPQQKYKLIEKGIIVLNTISEKSI